VTNPDGFDNAESTIVRVAIISDIHDNVPKLRSALEKLAKLGGAGELICLGDLCSPFVIAELGRGFSGPVHVVFGNNDGDRHRMADVASKFAQVTIHGEYAELDMDGRRFSVNHFDDIGKAIAAGQKFDVVCGGHSHQFGVEAYGKSVMVNPGEIFGILTGKSTFVIYDTRTGEIERVDVD
jgi:putative phosphoesterase